ncbi:MAG: methyltransferase [Planctomycetota bacterium]|nr:MAG: methyltransferase [Planctomycetota bacterium]
MTPRELVLRTLEFNKPSRVPRQLWLLPWASDHYHGQVKKIQSDFPDDIVHAPAVYEQKPKTTGQQFSVGRFVDEWGCVFENKQSGIVGEVKEPIVKTWDDVEKVHPPQEMLAFDTEKVNGFCKSTDKFVLAGCCARPFERIQFIRGTENIYMDLAMQEDGFKALLDKVHQFYLKELQLWAKTDVDGLMFMDDWGSQSSLLISPDMWRDIFKPLYKEYIDIAHNNGKKIFMHSDGYIVDIIPDLIELGLDALNSQIFCMGVEEVGKQFRGKITFWGEIDRQHILPDGSKEDVAAAVKQVKEALYADGGVIAQCEFGPGGKPENVYTVFETWNKLGEGQ